MKLLILFIVTFFTIFIVSCSSIPKPNWQLDIVKECGLIVLNSLKEEVDSERYVYRATVLNYDNFEYDYVVLMIQKKSHNDKKIVLDGSASFACFFDNKKKKLVYFINDLDDEGLFKASPIYLWNQKQQQSMVKIHSKMFMFAEGTWQSVGED